MDTSISVLCVDDESATLEVMGTYLERSRASFDVRTTRDPSEAVSMVRDESIDCVVADYEMPTVDGLELFELVRDHDPELPFIIYTARGSEAVASEAISAGVTDYLRKDVHSEQYEVLANRIENAVEARLAAEKRAETERALAQYETLVETVGDPMYVLDEDGVCQLANDALAEYTGYDRSDLEGAHFSQFVSEAHYEEATDHLLAMANSEQVQETIDLPIETIDGETTVGEAKIAAITDDDGRLVGSVGVLRDISERRARTRELSQYETIVNTVPLGIVVLDEMGIVKWANEQFSEATEWTLEEIIGMQFLEFVERGYFEDGLVDSYLDIVRRLLSSDTEDEVAVFNIDVRTDSGESRIYQAHTALLPLEDGEYQGTVTAFLDITPRERYQRELERQNSRLEQFARFVSHDLRNPINVAKGHVDLLEEEVDEEDESLETIAWAVEHMETLIDDLLSMARHGQTIEETEAVELEAVAEEAWAGVETAAATLEVEDSMTVEADSNRLRELLENLFRNAVEHGGSDVRVTVETIDWQEGRGTGDGPGFAVEDDGPGFTEELDDIFAFGATTREEGTGFGLGIVKQIAEAHGWSVDAETGEDGGARFEFQEVSGGDPHQK